MKTIQAVIFDWGGVLIENPSPDLDYYCVKELGVAADDFARVRETHYPAFLKGGISEAEFWNRACGDLGVPLPNVPSLWGDAFRRAYVPRKEMLFCRLAERAVIGRRSFRVPGRAGSLLFRELGYSMFDVLTFSCREQTAK